MPRWSATTKRFVLAAFLLGAIYVAYRAGDIVRPFVWAAILSYVLLPVVGFLESRANMRRSLVIGTVRTPAWNVRPFARRRSITCEARSSGVRKPPLASTPSIRARRSESVR